MTLEALRISLEQLGSGHDHKPVRIQLENGERIALTGWLFLRGGVVVLQGAAIKTALTLTIAGLLALSAAPSFAGPRDCHKHGTHTHCH